MIYMVELEALNLVNQLLATDDFLDGNYWEATGTTALTANDRAVPNGSLTADKIGATSSTSFSRVRQTIDLPAGVWTQSICLLGTAPAALRMATASSQAVTTFSNIGGAGEFTVNAEIIAGSEFLSLQSQVSEADGGFSKVEITTEILSPLAAVFVEFWYGGYAASNPSTGDLWLANAQLNAGAGAQEYLPNGTTRERTFYFASQHGGLTTAATDTPPNQHYAPRLENPGNYERSLFTQGTTRGRSEVGFGTIGLDNQDGGFDHLANYAFDGRACRIYRMKTRKDFASRELVLSGTVEQPELSFSRVNLRFRDRLAELSRVPVSPEFFAGTTTGPGATAEGTADLADQRKPVGFGQALSIPAVLSNPFNLLYTYSYRAADLVLAVRDAAVDYAFISDQPDLAALNAVSLTPGQYATCVAEGVLRIGGQPFGQIAVDAVFSGGTTPADIVDTLLTSLGITGLNQASRAALNADPDASMPCGIWVNGSDSALTVITRVLESVGAYITVNRQGEFVLGLLEPASGLPVTTWDETQLGLGGRLDRLATGDQGAGVPAKSVTIQFKPRYDNADVTGFAGRVTADVAAELARPFETAKADNQRVADERLLAPELEIETQLVNRADAEAQSARRLSFYDTVRERYRIAIPAELGPIELGEVRAIKHPRFGLAGGKSFTVIGVEEDFRLNRTVVDLWS
ncbi:MAG: hypothetical protein AAF556_06445 [Pseudomonadota bacterium]